MSGDYYIWEHEERRLWERMREYLEKYHNEILEETKIYGGSITKEDMIDILLTDIQNRENKKIKYETFKEKIRTENVEIFLFSTYGIGEKELYHTCDFCKIETERTYLYKGMYDTAEINDEIMKHIYTDHYEQAIKIMEQERIKKEIAKRLLKERGNKLREGK